MPASGISSGKARIKSPGSAGISPPSSLRRLKRNPDIRLYTPAPDLPVVSFNIRDLNNDEAGYILAKAYNIITRTGLHCAPLVHDRIDDGKGCVRVSFSHLTTPEECRTAADAVREVAEGAGR